MYVYNWNIHAAFYACKAFARLSAVIKLLNLYRNGRSENKDSWSYRSRLNCNKSATQIFLQTSMEIKLIINACTISYFFVERIISYHFDDIFCRSNKNTTTKIDAQHNLHQPITIISFILFP